MPPEKKGFEILHGYFFLLSNLCMVRNDTDCLWHLDTRTFAKAASDTFIGYVGLFQHADVDRYIRQRTGAITDPAGLALKRQAQGFIDHGVAHVDPFKDGVEFARNFLDGSCRAYIAAFHT